MYELGASKLNRKKSGPSGQQLTFRGRLRACSNKMRHAAHRRKKFWIKYFLLYSVADKRTWCLGLYLLLEIKRGIFLDQSSIKCYFYEHNRKRPNEGAGSSNLRTVKGKRQCFSIFHDVNISTKSKTDSQFRGLPSVVPSHAYFCNCIRRT